jgi:6-phosphogluconolactonase (cycloisomerase 2 family)
MKFNKVSQLLLVSFIGLLLAAGLSGCYLVTIAYVYVACSAGTGPGSAGQIYTYDVDGTSGALRVGPAPMSSGGTKPVAMATTANYYHLYVANQGNNSVVHFSIDDHGNLSQKESVTLPAPPVSIAVNQANTYLYVVSGTTSATLTEYPISNLGVIGSPTATVSLTLPGFAGDTIIPAGVAVLADSSAVYVAAYDKSAYNPGGSTTSDANPGWVFGYGVGSGGALTAVPGNPYQAGVKPSSIATDPVSRFVYVTDYASNELIGYLVQSGNSLTFMPNGPFKTGNEPTSVALDPRGLYIYLCNSLDQSISGYAISLPTGTPSTIVNSTASAGNSTDTEPVSVIVDPALGRFVYTANSLGNSLSGFKLNPETGALSELQATPYPTGVNPTALAAVPHGNHASQSVTP